MNFRNTLRRACLRPTSFLLTLCATLTVQAQEGKFEEFQYTTPDGQARPYVVYTPKQAKPGEKRPLIVYLHGAVSSPVMRIEPLGAAKRSVMSKLADEGNYYVLYPYGKQGCTWFDQVGCDMIFGEMDKVLSSYPIAQEKIFLSGFSDGASGTYYIASTRPEQFAGFIALNGALPVAANLGESPLYLDNFNHKPLYVVNTQSDMLYPAHMMGTLVEKMRQHHPDFIFRTPEGNHELSYFPSLQSEVKDFIDHNTRTTPTSLSFETADQKHNRYEWLTILEVSDQKPKADWHQVYTLKMTNDKASFGLMPNPKHRGPGLLVAGFGKKSCAKDMGVQVGDTILKMGDVEIKGPMDSFGYAASKRAGDSTSLTILRGGKEVLLTGTFPPPYQYEVFAKHPVSGKVRAQIDEQRLRIETSQVGALVIDFDQLPLKNKKKVEVVLNGKSHWLKKPQGLVRFTP